MVTGGIFATGELDSTEIFSDNIWRTVIAKLPVPMFDLGVITMNNRVLSFGKIRASLQLKKTNQT